MNHSAPNHLRAADLDAATAYARRLRSRVLRLAMHRAWRRVTRLAFKWLAPARAGVRADAIDPCVLLIPARGC